MVAIETSLNAPLLLRRLEQRGILAIAGGAGSVRMLAPLIIDRREADGIVEELAAIILAGRSPKRRATPERTTDDPEIVLPGRAARGWGSRVGS